MPPIDPALRFAKFDDVLDDVVETAIDVPDFLAEAHVVAGEFSGAADPEHRQFGSAGIELGLLMREGRQLVTKRLADDL